MQSLLHNLEIIPRDIALYRQALTHKSYINESGKRSAVALLHNQRLEFLGDAVLGTVMAEYLYQKFPFYEEGKLTRMKSGLVCGETLTLVGNRIGLGNYLLLGKGEKSEGGKMRDSNIEDALEAFIAAIFLDRGMGAAKKFILRLWNTELNNTNFLERDPKSTLQEWLAKHKQTRPQYRLLEESGPDHQKIFTVGLFIYEQWQLSAKAASRKKAEQEAARLFLEQQNFSKK